MSLCHGQSGSAQGPSCPKTNCGKCYKVTNQGGIPVNQAVGGIGNSVIVQIIDACPQSNPQNYCKTDMAANQRCEDPNTNQLDIDSSAYEVLTGQAFGNVSGSFRMAEGHVLIRNSKGPNLQILIEDSDCSGGTSGGGSAPGSATPPPPSSTANASPSGPPQAPATQASTESAVAASPSPAQPGVIPIVIPSQSGELNNNVNECYDEDIGTS